MFWGYHYIGNTHLFCYNETPKLTYLQWNPTHAFPVKHFSYTKVVALEEKVGGKGKRGMVDVALKVYC